MPRRHVLPQVPQVHGSHSGRAVSEGTDCARIEFQGVHPLLAAADRLFDDFVVLVMIGVAIAIAMFVVAALRKMVRGY